jgi:hypothetical protein
MVSPDLVVLPTCAQLGEGIGSNAFPFSNHATYVLLSGPATCGMRSTNEVFPVKSMNASGYGEQPDSNLVQRPRSLVAPKRPTGAEAPVGFTLAMSLESNQNV